MPVTVVTSDNPAGQTYVNGVAAEPTATVAPEGQQADGATPAAKPDTKGEPNAPDNKASSAPAGDSQPAATDDANKGRNRLEKRFSDLTETIRTKDEQLAAAQAELARLKAAAPGQTQQAPSPPKGGPAQRPDPADFNDPVDFQTALVEWGAERALAAREARQAGEQASNAWTDRVAATATQIDDFHEVLSTSKVQIPNAVRDAIFEMDDGPLVLYHIATTDGLAERLVKMSASKAVIELGRLSDKLATPAQPPADKQAPEATPKNAPPVVKTSKAPPPINPVRTGSSDADLPVGADGQWQGTFAQYVAAREAGRLK